jgi:hypothetical protein
MVSHDVSLKEQRAGVLHGVGHFALARDCLRDRTRCRALCERTRMNVRARAERRSALAYVRTPRRRSATRRCCRVDGRFTCCTCRTTFTQQFADDSSAHLVRLYRYLVAFLRWRRFLFVSLCCARATP